MHPIVPMDIRVFLYTPTQYSFYDEIDRRVDQVCMVCASGNFRFLRLLAYFN